MTPPDEPFWHFWCRHMVAQWTARPFMEQHMAREQAAMLEAAEQRVAHLEAEAKKLQRVFRATRHGIRLPWQNPFPVH